MDSKSIGVYRRIVIRAAAVAIVGVASAATWSGELGHGGSGGADKGGHVLSPRAELFGYSLEDTAKATATFNAGDHSTPPALPFQMLYTNGTNAFTVSRGTFLYVPVFFNDDSPPVIGDFPNIHDRKALLRYLFSHTEVGIQYLTITVDGKETSLGDDYVVAIDTAPLPDGGGTHYMVFAAYLSPLGKGSHTVEIAGLATGAALVPWCAQLPAGVCTPDSTFEFELSYSVSVK